MNRRDLRPSYDFLASMANSPEREKCADTIHELALHNTERAIKAEALVRELVGVIDELRRQINECGLDGEMWDMYQKAKEVLGE